jgi:rubrerythrin
MDAKYDAMLDMFCTAVQMKEKKRALYEEAMKNCPDQVGIETFRMLWNSEDEHLQNIRAVYEDLKKGKVSLEACRLHEFDSKEKKDYLRKLAREHGKISKACLDDVAAIETGIDLENASIGFFVEQQKRATDPAEKELLNRLIEGEREHFIVLNDLKMYYVDPSSWFLEKSGARLDGAGSGT